MRDRILRLVRNTSYISVFALSLLLVTLSLTATLYARSNINPPRHVGSAQNNTPWCFSRLEDKERKVGFYLSHPRAITGEKLLENYGMPTEWLESLGDPVCPSSWDKAAEFLDAAQVITFFQDRIIYSLPENLRARYGRPWVGIIDMPLYPPTGSTLDIEEVWCYSFFQQDGAEEGVFLGHFPGLESEKVLARHADVLDMTQSWTERGSECFATWNLARSFAYYLTEDQVPHFGLDEFLEARSVLEIDRMAWPAHSLLAPYGQSALLEPDARPVWCHTIFTGGGGSTMTFNHYPDQSVEDVLAFYNPPSWIKDLAARQETNCYTSWEAAFRARPLEWKKYLLTLLPANPTEVDFEAVLIEEAFSDRWQEFRRPEFSAEGTPDPLMLTRIAPTPTVTPTPTLTPTTDPRTISQDNAVWCFTHVEDLSHEVVFYMGHPPGMSLNDIRQAYNLPPGLLSQPDRETFCYEDWGEAAVFVSGDINGPYFNLPQGKPSIDLFQEYQSTIEQTFGIVLTGSITSSDARYPANYYNPDQHVWCYSYFTKGDPDSGLYLGHYVTEGDEAILTDYALDTTVGWKRIETSSHCFMDWQKLAHFYWKTLNQQILSESTEELARIFITERQPILFAGEPIPADTPTVTPTPTVTRRSPGAILLDPDVTQAVWCYTIFTGGGNSTANFGHYPGLTTEEVISLYSAPLWVKDLAAQQETNCYASWAAAFEGLAPPALKLTLAPYLPENPAEADYETVILWSYFNDQVETYRRPEFSAEGTPQALTLTRIATPLSVMSADTTTTLTVTPTPLRSPNELVWCFSLFYDDTPEIEDVMIAHYPDMDNDEISAFHHLKENFLKERPEQRTICFYSYTDAATFRQELTANSNLMQIRVAKDEAGNQASLETRYSQLAFEVILPDSWDYVMQAFDTAPSPQPENQDTVLPTPNPDAPLLDTENHPVWCATYFRAGDQIVVLGHYPGMNIAEVLERYEVTSAEPTYIEEKRVCYATWKEAANNDYFRADYLDAPNYNEGDYEIMVLQNFFTDLWQVYQQPEFSAEVTPQVFQTPPPVPTATPALPSAAALLDGDALPRWCRTAYVNQQGKESFYGHYPDIDPIGLLLANGIRKIQSTDCYATWRAAAESMPEAEFSLLDLPADPTEADYELAQLKLFFGELGWRREQREEFSAGSPVGGFTPDNLENIVWCNYTIARKNTITGQAATVVEIDNYPNMTVEEVLLDSLMHKGVVNEEPRLRAVICYSSWQEAMETLFPDGLKAHKDNLPDMLNNGDYEVLFLWFKFSKDWKQRQRPEFSADQSPNPATLDYIKGITG